MGFIIHYDYQCSLDILQLSTEVRTHSLLESPRYHKLSPNVFSQVHFDASTIMLASS